MEANGVAVDQFRGVDHDLAPGVYPDMREHGAGSGSSDSTRVATGCGAVSTGS
jgi:hypothetical protein